jgi:hypothetical protein
MAPVAQTIFSVSLFFALVALLLWAKRRRRASESARRAVAGIRATLSD